MKYPWIIFFGFVAGYMIEFFMSFLQYVAIAQFGRSFFVGTNVSNERNCILIWSAIEAAFEVMMVNYSLRIWLSMIFIDYSEAIENAYNDDFRILTRWNWTKHFRSMGITYLFGAWMGMLLASNMWNMDMQLAVIFFLLGPIIAYNSILYWRSSLRSTTSIPDSIKNEPDSPSSTGVPSSVLGILIGYMVHYTLTALRYYLAQRSEKLMTPFMIILMGTNGESNNIAKCLLASGGLIFLGIMEHTVVRVLFRCFQFRKRNDNTTTNKTADTCETYDFEMDREEGNYFVGASFGVLLAWGMWVWTLQVGSYLFFLFEGVVLALFIRCYLKSHSRFLNQQEFLNQNDNINNDYTLMTV